MVVTPQSWLMAAPSGNKFPRERRRQMLKLFLRSDTFPLCSLFIGQSKSYDMTDSSQVGRTDCPPTGQGGEMGSL